MQDRRIAVCTRTFYPHWNNGETADSPEGTNDKVRGDLALQFMEMARRRYRLVVADATGPESPFGRAVRQWNGDVQVVPASPGISTQLRTAYAAAMNDTKARVLVSTEPEKTDLIGEVDRLADDLLADRSDLLVPERSDESWNTYPSYQRETEGQANRTIARILEKAGLTAPGMNLDILFGPKLFSVRSDVRARMVGILWRQLVTADPKLKPAEHGDALNLPVARALQAKLRVRGLTVNFAYPPSQLELEAFHPELASRYREKRLEQVARFPAEFQAEVQPPTLTA